VRPHPHFPKQVVRKSLQYVYPHPSPITECSCQTWFMCLPPSRIKETSCQKKLLCTSCLIRDGKPVVRNGLCAYPPHFCDKGNWLSEILYTYGMCLLLLREGKPMVRKNVCESLSPSPVRTTSCHK
jgi:hypothetical protein